MIKDLTSIEEEKNRLLYNIEEDKYALTVAFADWKETTLHKVNVRDQITDHPTMFLFGGFCLGFYFGTRH